MNDAKHYCAQAVHALERLARGAIKAASGDPTGRPFFIAAGLYKPHLPWVAPQSFYANAGVPRNPMSRKPDGVPAVSLATGSAEMKHYYGVTGASRKNASYAEPMLRKAYVACTAYADAQVV